MKIKKLYEILCKIVGLSAILVLLYGLILGFFGVIFSLNEPIIPILIIELLVGFLVLPYWIKSFIWSLK